MSDKRIKKDSVEVSSQPLQDELVAIKDRLSAIETIQSISNAPVVEKYVEKHLTTDKANEFFQPAWVASPAELTRDTGWRAARDLRTGLAETHQWYRSAGWL